MPDRDDAVSLDPLTPEEALRALLSIPPMPVERDDDEPENAAERANGDE